MRREKNVNTQNPVPQKKKNIKTTLRNLLVLVLVAAVSVVGTLAFLSRNSEKKVNTFTGSAGIDLELTEPAWTTTDTNRPVKGEDMAKSYTPEMVIPKDPTLTNNSQDANAEEWVAIRVDYTYEAGNSTYASTTRADLEENLIEALDDAEDADGNIVGIDTSEWIKLPTKVSDASNASDTAYEIYLYKTKLAQNQTATLFKQVKIKSQDALKNKKLGKAADGSGGVDVFNSTTNKFIEFRITLYGAAIKNDTSIADSLNSIGTISDINMSGDFKPADGASDSQKIALALAKLLKDLPNTP